MKQGQSIHFISLEEFLVHAHALEQELTERYQEMADSLEVHNNLAVAELFHKLADYGATHAGALIQQANSQNLPQAAPWEYQWLTQNGLEACMQDTHYQMTSSEALRLALRIEHCALTFYTQTTDDSSALGINKQQHLKLLQEWLDEESEPQPGPAEDLDPPHIPE